MKVAIVKYNAGNTASVANAFSRLGVDAVITDDAEVLGSSDRVIFPGVGEASTSMRFLRDRKLDELVKSLKQPVLGVCLGMQLLCEYSEENDTRCLGIVPYRVKKFASGGLKIPHMGWNQIGNLRTSLFEGVDDGAYVYFVHGYYVGVGDMTTAECDYGERFSAAISHKNFHAVQFHTEKSGEIGLRILENFLKI